MITGASAGVGRAVAREFARRGWRVGLIARGREGLDSAAAEVERLGSDALVLPADVSDADAVFAAAESAANDWGQIDVWINVAMATLFARFEEIAPEEYRRATEVTYLGQVNGTRAALRHMRRRGTGTIVHVGSALAFRGIPLQSAYCGAKFAIRGFVDSVRAELLHDGSSIRLSMVHLPAVNTPQFDWARNKMAERPQPVPPIFAPDAVAPAIFKAAIEAPRELLVGRSTLQVIAGNALAPGFLDRMLSSKGYSGQQSGEQALQRPDNLFEPVSGDFGAQGRFSGQAESQAAFVNPAHLRAGAAAAGVALGALAYAWARNRSSAPPRVARVRQAAQAPLWPSRARSDDVEGPAPLPVAYPPIEKHGVIGDRRTAAMVAADGTIDWWCLPNFDHAPVFGSILDAERGGFWRMGPAFAAFGRQRYLKDTAVLVTRWEHAEGVLELSDAMLWPETERAAENTERRVIVRRLRSLRGTVPCTLELSARDDFQQEATTQPVDGGMLLSFDSRTLGMWCSQPLSPAFGGAAARFDLEEGEEVWAVLGLNEAPSEWSLARARSRFSVAATFWQRWAKRVTYVGPRRERVRRSALTLQLLSFAPSGALVAAPTASLPERIGGDRNYDYRFAWIRDVSLSLAVLSVFGDLETAERYMDWLSGLDSSTGMPLQVLYRIDGGTDTSQHLREGLSGYRGSKPVQFGNHAYQQKQIDALGYLADCALIYLEQSGPWKPEYWELLRRLAEYTSQSWREPGNGIWELGQDEHHVSSKVMSWVTLQRTIKIAEQTGIQDEAIERWRTTMEEIRAEVMDQGWSDTLQAFRQRYGAETLDASVLLIPIMGFLPADHPRVRSTIERIAQALTVDGFVYRFDPNRLPQPEGPLGEAEGAFLPATFWLAAALAMLGEAERAEAILKRAEAIAGELGLFAEEADPRTRGFLGNTPLLFSHGEYLRAVMELDKARPLSRAALMSGRTVSYARNWMGSS